MFAATSPVCCCRIESLTWRCDISLCEILVLVQVGDFVDAQDAEGKWYESVVREVSTDTVKVHYIGWASRWDTTIRRFTAGPVPLGVRSVRMMIRLARLFDVSIVQF